MTAEESIGRMRDAEVVETSALLDKPKRFVREILRMPDGHEIDWYYVDVPESVMVVPITQEGTVVMVEQYRHNLRSRTLELPAGLQDGDEAMESAALRELAEETGHELADAAVLEALGRFYASPSETNKWVNIFLAAPVRFGASATGDTEIEKYFEMSVVELPLAEAMAEIGKSIHGIETAGALMLAQQKLAPRH